MTRKIIITLFCIVGIILLIPLIAIQFSLEVHWTLSDFIIAGSLLISFGFLTAFVWNKLGQSKYGLFVIAGLLLVLLLLWAELAVGIFGSPIAGS